ncbi:hypothetical protein NQ318_015200 [Aromia moschata]|uniref:Uncharacterized protein n=1 Tax=Aromia moschata TaxID=1265417 RepID=A0AAV8XJT7_9CUCU|nr:hypothetical protein NQ318_015200 [Aromia moschata]
MTTVLLHSGLTRTPAISVSSPMSKSILHGQNHSSWESSCPLPSLTGYCVRVNKFFREPSDVGTGPLVATYVFIFSVFLLLWDIRLYPKSLRKLGRLCQCFIEFVIAAFLFENILMDFWFPLEIGVLALPQKAAGLIEDLLATGSWNCPTSLCDGLRSEQTGYVLSYLLSFFFLFAVLQATRAIDLRELE